MFQRLVEAVHEKTLKTKLRLFSGLVSLLLSPSLVPPAYAQSKSVTAPTAALALLPGSAGNLTKTDQTAVVPAGFWGRSNLCGDIGGLRSWLSRYGVTIGLQETSEYMRNWSGGIQHGGAYDGVTQLGIGVDTQKIFRLPGGIFNVSGLQIHGTSLS